MATVDAPLAHGYTLADLHRLARLAVHTAGTMTSNWHDRYDTAWSAIAEHLYAADHWPARGDLVRAGQLAIYAVVDDNRQAYGYYRRKSDGGAHGVASSPAFRTYWWDICGTTPSRSPEGPVVERMALAQILPLLTPTQRQVITALAVHDDYRAGAAALGMTYVTFRSHVSRARTRFLAWWHEHETPSRPWGCDRRVGSYARDRITGRRTNTEIIATRRGYPRTRQAARTADRETS